MRNWNRRIGVGKAKKIFTRMCLNNWGGITHKVLEFHEYVNLFAGKSGSGKSTVMDAIQVILYGSFSPSFLNKAADDAKNRRSVLGYLRGEQKDGTANREGCDFCSTIVLEIEDTGNQRFTCVGMAFEVRKSDSEIKKFLYFSHLGKLPEDNYLSAGGYPYTNKEIKELIEERAKSGYGRGGAEINRFYPSKEAYLNTLYDSILGYIDGSRFVTMEKSAIALKMTNGTGQFIRDYMFPKNTGDVIEKISAQLGAYRDIKEKIDDMKRRIDLLSRIQEASGRRIAVGTDIVRAQAFIRCVDVEDLKNRMETAREEIARTEGLLAEAEERKAKLGARKEGIEEELIQVQADLQGSDLGVKENQRQELEKRCAMLQADSAQWQKIVQGLRRWEEDRIITDYVTNPALARIADFCKGKVTAELCRSLRSSLESIKENIEEELEDYNAQKRAAEKEIKELRRLVEDMENDRKPYPASLQKARFALERRLSEVYGRTVKVYVFADLFDVRDPEWRDAVEGRMGRLKLSLVTEPQYAYDAAALFREMRGFEEVDLINTKAAGQSGTGAMGGSLYEAVETKLPYIDACLKRYLGHIIKCRSVEELEKVRDGVTPDCYSYSNFIFRHLKKNDYEKYACIGSRVSRAKQQEYMAELEKLEKDYGELSRMASGLKTVREFECLHGEDEYLLRLSGAGKELEKALGKLEGLKNEISVLKEGKYKELRARQQELLLQKKKTEEEAEENWRLASGYAARKGALERDLASGSRELEEKLAGYVPGAETEALVAEALKKRSGQALKNQKRSEIERLEQIEQEELENLQNARNRFNREYPSVGFNGMEKTNEVYDRLLSEYQNDYEPKYQSEFEKQCEFIYKSLRDNVIATIHGDINAARRHTHEINRLLRKTNFSDSTYQIKIEPARNANGQFYEMLTAPELDSKNIDNGGFDGQISLEEDAFYRKYEQKIKLLTDKFVPLKSGDEYQMEQKHREMEQYADYRNYLSFSMFEQVTDAEGNVIRENFVDDMAGRDSGGEGQNPKYVALLAGFAMLYMQQSNRDSRIKLVLLDEAFSKMDQERSAVCLKYARKMDLQLIVCVPDERLQSLIRNVDSVYGFRRHQNQISMMHIDKGDYLKMMEGEV